MRTRLAPTLRINARQAQKEATRDKLLNAAGELMSERDTLDFSLIEVAARAGVSPTLIQYHFGGRDGLLLAIVERGTQRAVEQLAKLEKLDAPAPRKLKLHVEGLVAAYVQAPYINSLINMLIVSGDEQRARYVSDIFVKPVADFHKMLLRQGVAEGSFREIDPMHFYFILAGACENFVSRRVAHFYVFGDYWKGSDVEKLYAKSVYEVVAAGLGCFDAS
jgi:TetR/AcrR family transcriptional regulator